MLHPSIDGLLSERWSFMLSINLNHMLMVGVSVAKGALGKDGDVGEDIEEC